MCGLSVLNTAESRSVTLLNLDYPPTLTDDDYVQIVHAAFPGNRRLTFRGATDDLRLNVGLCHRIVRDKL